MADVHPRPRQIAIRGIAVGVAALLVLVVAVALRGCSRPPDRYVHAGSLATLREGHVRTVELRSFFDRELNEHRTIPVFVVRNGVNVLALLGRSTHLGCRVEDIARPRGEGSFAFVKHAEARFADPCGGSAWDLNGTCLEGPCPRGLDRLSTSVDQRGRIVIDRESLQRGPPRTTTTPAPIP